MTLTIKEIEEKLQGYNDDEDSFIKLLENDQRKGVQRLLAQWKKKQEEEQKEKQRLQEMTVFEQEARENGATYIAGIDEVGRGPLAGPVVAAAVILPDHFYPAGVDDSKKLSKKRREALYDLILEKALSVGIGVVEADEIDRLNIYEATKKAMLTAIHSLQRTPDYLLLDAMNLAIHLPQKSIIKGDRRSLTIACASIVAKVYRDRLMENFSKTYPQYHFEKNAGYATKEHLEALERYGPCPIHRKSFSPIKEMLAPQLQFQLE